MSDILLDSVPRAKEILLWIYGQYEASHNRYWPERGIVRSHCVHDLDVLTSLIEHRLLEEAWSTYRLTIKALVTLPEVGLELGLVDRALKGLNALFARNTDAEYTVDDLAKVSDMRFFDAQRALGYLQFCQVTLPPPTGPAGRLV
jgi:hypothetical protein